MAIRELTKGLKRCSTGVLLALCVFATPLVHAESTFPGVSWSNPDQTVRPNGWSKEKLELADDFAASIRSDAYLVVHRGSLVHAYGDISKPMNLASVRKSVLSVLYGIYVDRGVIDLSHTLADLNVTDKGRLSDLERTATVRQLLQARSGVYHLAAYETPDAKRERPARGSHAPGEFWYYNNWDFNALGSIFQLRTGKTVFETLKTDLADPLQFEDFRYPQDTEFVYESNSDHPAYVMNLSARDLARVGLLVSRDGQWKGRQIVSSNWLRESTTSYTTVGRGWSGYGYLWWVPLKAFPSWRQSSNQLALAVGFGGQFMLIDRARDIVVVHRVNNRRLWFKRNEVTDGQFAALAARIIAAAPNE